MPDLREILQARIASFEEEAAKLKGLSELKQGWADEQDPPPHNQNELRQKALEHQQNAITLLTSAEALKAVLGQRTKAEQIALMRHYVLEFGQSASRNARLSNSLADNDPQKAIHDQHGRSEMFVVSVLNSLLIDVAPEPSGKLSTAQPSMAGRLGQVLRWTANVIALAVLALFLAVFSGYREPVVLLAGLVAAALIWAIGRALRYVLAGS